MRRWGIVWGIVWSAVCGFAGFGWAAQQGSDIGTYPPPSHGGGPNEPFSWHPYGNVLRGSSYYNTKPFLGLAAKGNIVVGDYTSDSFHNNVLRLMDGGISLESVTGPYVLPDPTDSALGYDNGGALCGGQTPCFRGDYTAEDGGLKTDGTGRKFYESSLPDDVFRELVQPGWGKMGDGIWRTGGTGDLRDPHPCFGGEGTDACRGDALHIQAALFTNHAIIGDVGRSSWMGSWVARDDIMRFQGRFDMMHDWRLMDREFRQRVGLPASVAPARVVSWEEVPPQ